MHFFVYVPFVVATGFGLGVVPLSRRLFPRGAVVLLLGGAAISTGATWCALAILGSTLLAQNNEVAEEGGWSVGVFRHHDPVNRAVAGLAIIALLAALVRGAIQAVRSARNLAVAARAAALAGDAELVVSPDPHDGAYAVPGRPGRIVVSASLLRSLSAVQTRALMAHERSHLRHRHSALLAVARTLAAANPLLRRLPAALGYAIERWADEDAAAEVGSRRLAATAVAAAAVIATRPARFAAALSVARSHVPSRVRALLAPPPSPNPVLVGLVLVLILATALATYHALSDTATMFELAMRAYHHLPHR